MKAMTIRLPDDLHEQIRRVAFERRTSMNQLIVELLEQIRAEETEA